MTFWSHILTVHTSSPFHYRPDFIFIKFQICPLPNAWVVIEWLKGGAKMDEFTLVTTWKCAIHLAIKILRVVQPLKFTKSPGKSRLHLKLVESKPVPNNDFSIIQFTYSLCHFMTVYTDFKVFYYSNCYRRFSLRKTISNSQSFTIFPKSILFFSITHIQQYRCDPRFLSDALNSL